MTEQTSGAATDGRPARGGLTNAEQLVALQSYLKALKPQEEALRAATLADMRTARAERVGAYMPDGMKIGAVGYNPGNKTAKVTDDAAALRWCIAHYPDEIIQAINPAFLKRLLDVAKTLGEVGEPGVDPLTGEALPFIEVTRGTPFVTATPTKEGVAVMSALAGGFTLMLEVTDGWEPRGKAPCDPEFADRLENGAYER